MTIYVPNYNYGRREIMEISPRWRCFADRSNAHAVFIDGYHFHDGQMFRTPEAVWRYWQKMPAHAGDRYTVPEILAAWQEVTA